MQNESGVLNTNAEYAVNTIFRINVMNNVGIIYIEHVIILLSYFYRYSTNTNYAEYSYYANEIFQTYLLEYYNIISKMLRTEYHMRN